MSNKVKSSFFFLEKLLECEGLSSKTSNGKVMYSISL